RTMTATTPVEQYVIHVQDSNRVEKVSSELMGKFAQIIRSSHFLQGENQGQLSITLKPEHLGNIQVRLLQVDGEMTVRLIVSTQMAREMLETNVHQLKHLFAPHQITIERDEQVSDDEFFGEQREEEEERAKEEKEGFTSDENDDETVSEIDFQTLMEELRKEEEFDD